MKIKKHDTFFQWRKNLRFAPTLLEVLDIIEDREGYRGISRDWIQGWGQGLALAYLAGIINYDKIRSDGAL